MKGDFKYVRYEDIPKDERKKLMRIAIGKNKSIRWWSGFACGFACLVGITIANGLPYDSLGRTAALVLRVVFSGVLSGGLAFVFWSAIVDPRVRRAVEREKNCE